ncbi:MAG: hypothetical protein K2M07_05850 [Muribaculaceae bacterium]|nr:hypothetical protein [Muribaculaceae bacterium]
MNIHSAKDLRALLSDNAPVRIDTTPGIYRWWCDLSAALPLLSPLPVAGLSRLQTREIEGRQYLAIYFGISKNLRARLEWHIAQTHTASAIKAGTISTLRQALGALTATDLSANQDMVNDFMDTHCLIEYLNVDSLPTAEQIEASELSRADYYYPLNIRSARSTPKEIKKVLKYLRKIHKK